MLADRPDCAGGGFTVYTKFCTPSFNKTYSTEVLDCYVFDSLQEVRDMTADWMHRYNHHRPHEALGRIPPVEYRVKLFPNLYF